jgi:hypothetical protein
MLSRHEYYSLLWDQICSLYSLVSTWAAIVSAVAALPGRDGDGIRSFASAHGVVLRGWNLADWQLSLQCALAHAVPECFDLPARVYPNPMGGVVNHAVTSFRIVPICERILLG